MSETKQRLDQFLVDQGLAPSRTKAKELIESEQVEVEGARGFQVITQASFPLKTPPPKVRIKSAELLKYVSRGGLKLEGALKCLNLNVNGLSCLDLGSSTGGFIHCLLEKGAEHITGVEVGSGQLAQKLQGHPKITNFENLNIKNLIEDERFKDLEFDFVTADLSFISVKLALAPIKKLLRSGGQVLLLIKPQFELGSGALNKKGIVKDKDLYVGLESEITQALKDFGFDVLDYFSSPITGRDGNREFFIYAKN